MNTSITLWMGDIIRVMIDTNIFDRILDSGEVAKVNELSERGHLEILTTHIQEDEIDSIPDERRKTQLKRIHRNLAPTDGGVYGISRIGMATVGNGTAGVKLDDIDTKERKHVRDSLRATSGARFADVLVTDDKRLYNKMSELNHSCTIWKSTEFLEFIKRS